MHLDDDNTEIVWRKKEAMIIYFIYIYINSTHVNGEYLIGLLIMIWLVFWESKICNSYGKDLSWNIKSDLKGCKL